MKEGKKYFPSTKVLKKYLTSVNPNVEENIKSNIEDEIRKNRKIRKEKTKIEYCVEIYEELNKLMEAFDNLRDSSNGIIKRESFHELVTRVLKIPKGMNNHEHLNTKIDGETQNIGKRVEELIDRLKKDEVIKNVEQVLSCVTKRMECVKQLYSTKHFFTISLVNASKKYPNLIRLENDPIKEGGKTGVVDVYYKDAAQVFGAHYKYYEIEAKDYRIQSLPRVDQRVNEAFNKKNPLTNDSYISTYIPFDTLNETQRKDAKKALDMMDNPSDIQVEDEYVFNQIRTLGKTPDLLDVIKLRLELATDIQRFNDKNVISLTPLQMKAVNTAMIEFKNGATIEELSEVFTPIVIEHIKKIQLKDMPEQSKDTGDLKDRTEYDTQSVAAAMRNGHFKMAIDYDQINQERANSINLIEKQNDGKSKED